MQFSRSLMSRLGAWKINPFRKPLLLKGARQVGKTSLLKTFGAMHFKDVAYFNFEESPDLKQLFEQSKDVQFLLQNLSLLHGKSIVPQETLLILDEIQVCNAALNSLKYFCENASEYAIVAAGSLLGITLGKENTFPVGKVDFMTLQPLTFLEFLGQAAPNLSEYIQQKSDLTPIPDIFLKPLKHWFRLYFTCGGMPEAAHLLVAYQQLEESEQSLKNILNGYEMDFAKHTSFKELPRIHHLWHSIPSQLAKENKKFLYQVIRSGARAREYEEALWWLLQAGLVYKVPLCKAPRLPLSSYDDLSAFKLYTLDVGLLRVLSQLHAHAFQEGNRLFVEFKGALTENYVLQSLKVQFNQDLRYWTSNGKAEIDFLLPFEDNILPIEVKADENIKSKSLFYYNELYEPPLRIRYSLRNFSYKEGLLNIPLFMADETEKWIRLGLEEM